jgi:predicted nucleic acid-binding protein
MVDILRGHAPAQMWLRELGSAELGVPGLVAMELVQGCRNRAERSKVERLLRRHRLFWPTPHDCERAYSIFSRHHLSHGIGILDALIAATAVGLGVTLVTFNQKHYNVIGSLQVQSPYSRSVS